MMELNSLKIVQYSLIELDKTEQSFSSENSNRAFNEYKIIARNVAHMIYKNLNNLVFVDHDLD